MFSMIRLLRDSLLGSARFEIFPLCLGPDRIRERMANFPDLEAFFACNAQPFTPAEDLVKYKRQTHLGRKSSYVFSLAAREESTSARGEPGLDSRSRQSLLLETISALSL